MEKKRVTILYNIPLPRELAEMGTYSREKAKEILAKYPQLDLSESAVLEELHDMVVALNASGFEARAVNINDDFDFLIEELRLRRPDVIFNLCESMHSVSKNEAYIAGVYELFRIPYTGAAPEALSIAVRKARTKAIFMEQGIPTAPFALFASPDAVHLNGSFSFPCIVKPAEEDASIGIEPAAIVRSEQAIKDRVAFILEKYHQPALVENYIDGRELNVAILGDAHPEILPISEIDFSTLPEGLPKILSYQAKWVEDSEYYKCTIGKCPAELPADVEARVKDIAMKAFRAIGVRDYARVDFRLTRDMQPFVLEVNPNPDLASNAGFMRSVRGAGRTFEQTLAKIVGFALERAA